MHEHTNIKLIILFLCNTYKLYTYIWYYNWTDLCITAYKFVFFPCSALVIFCHHRNKVYVSRYFVFFECHIKSQGIIQYTPFIHTLLLHHCKPWLIFIWIEIQTVLSCKNTTICVDLVCTTLSAQKLNFAPLNSISNEISAISSSYCLPSQTTVKQKFRCLHCWLPSTNWCVVQSVL